MYNNVSKSDTNINNLKKIYKYLGGYKKLLYFNIALCVISVIILIIIPQFTGAAVTELFNIYNRIQNNTSFNFNKIYTIVIIMFFLYTTSNLSSFLQQIISLKINQDIVYKLRKDLCIKLNKIPIDYYTRVGTGNMLSIITNDIDTLSASLHHIMTDLITTTCLVILVTIIIFILDFKIAILIFLLTIFMFIVIFPISRKSRKAFKKQRKYLGDLNTTIEETYNGLETIQTFSEEENIMAEFDQQNLMVKKMGRSGLYFSSLVFPLINLFTGLSSSIIVFIGIYSVIFYSSPVGIIPTFLQYFRQMMSSVNSLGNTLSVFQQAMAASDRIFAFLAEDEDIDRGKYNISTLKNSVKFENVSFGYDKTKLVLNNLNFYVEKGKSIGIVGRTGVGKTTLYNLLLRFYDTNSGSIKFDDVNINQYTKTSLREIIGMVTQDSWLFSGSIYDNIKIGDLDACKDQVIAASKLSNAHHFIQQLPKGYDTIIDEDNSNLSQGQKQLLTIARVMLKNPKILVLDEATSSIDTRTEILIDEALDKLSINKTRFIVAHRLSTIKNVDVILLIKDGQVVEKGTHKELLNKKGYYYDLYTSQFQYGDR